MKPDAVEAKSGVQVGESGYGAILTNPKDVLQVVGFGIVAKDWSRRQGNGGEDQAARQPLFQPGELLEAFSILMKGWIECRVEPGGEADQEYQPLNGFIDRKKNGETVGEQSCYAQGQEQDCFHGLGGELHHSSKYPMSDTQEYGYLRKEQ